MDREEDAPQSSPEESSGEPIYDHDLDLDLVRAAEWFARERGAPALVVRVHADVASRMAELLGIPLRRCYVTDLRLRDRAERTGRSVREILQAHLPDPGSVMAGDYGEILTCIYEATQHLPETALSPKKWRLKQDPQKPSPHSDVVHFILPAWPEWSRDDLLICSEVKTKSTAGSFRPIPAAIDGAEKDRTSRLTATLLWLRARALGEDLGAVELAHIERFLHADEDPPATKQFQAVVVLCDSLAADEIDDIPDEEDPNCRVVLLIVPHLREVYSSTYEEVLASVSAQTQE